MTEIHVALPAGETCSAKAYLMHVHGISGSLWRRIKHHGAFTLNGIPAVAARTMLKDGDWIAYDLPIVSSVIPESLPLSIIYEDDDLLVLDKPAGQLVHPTTKETHGTIANAVRGYYAACGVHLDVHPCHRLDRNTSGLLLIAKHPEVQYQIMRQNALRREYLTLIEGTLIPPAGCIDAPIARALPSIILRCVAEGGKPARTHYETQRTNGKYSLLRLWHHTGRTHQIRVHQAQCTQPHQPDHL